MKYNSIINKLKTLRLIAFAGTIIISLQAQAQTNYYMTPDGTGPAGTPWETCYTSSQIDYVLNTLMGPGDTLYLGSGDYENCTLHYTTSGTSSSWKRIIGVDTGDNGGGFPSFVSTGSKFWDRTDPEENGTQWAFINISGDYWQVENLKLHGARYAIRNGTGTSPSHQLFRNIEIEYALFGLFAEHLDHAIFENVTVKGYSKHAFRLRQGCNNVTFRQCEADLSNGDEEWWNLSIDGPAGFIVDDEGPSNTNITFIDCVARNNLMNNQPGAYAQGDGFVVNRGNTGLTFIRCIAVNNDDGGFDVKQTSTYDGCVAVKNSINFRLWNSASQLTNCVAAYPRKRFSGSNSIQCVWSNANGTAGNSTLDYCTLHSDDTATLIDAEDNSAITVTNSILSYSGTGGGISLGNVSISPSANNHIYDHGSGTDPDFVNPSADWSGIGNDMDSEHYGQSAGYHSVRLPYEAEDMLIQGTNTISEVSDTAASNDMWIMLGSTATNEWIEFNLPNAPAGNYSVVARTRKNNWRGIYQLSVNGNDVGSPVDHYSSSTVYEDITVGDVTLSSDGDATFRFTVVGKNPSSNGHTISVDSIKLVPEATIPSGSIVFNTAQLTDYSNQTTSGSTTLNSSQTAITMTGNNWRRYPFNYNVTTSTMLEVTVNSSESGEIIGIGFDDNNTYNDIYRIFRFSGTQPIASSFFYINPEYIEGSGSITYVIPVGSYYTGSMSHLCFLADADSYQNADVTFSNVRVYEAPAPAVVFNSAQLTDYSGQTTSGNFSLDSTQTALTMTGNIWRRFPLNYNVTSSTVLEVTIDSPESGEIIGIGFDDNDAYNDIYRIFRFSGTQPISGSFFYVNPEYTEGEGPVTYVIPVGSYYGGSMSHLCFLADADSYQNANVTFSDIRIYEDN